MLSNGRFCVLLELCIAFVYMTRLTPTAEQEGELIGKWAAEGDRWGGFIGRLLRAVEKANTR